MRWHHAYCSYNNRSQGKKGHFATWWDTAEGDREIVLEESQIYHRTILDHATKNGWEFVGVDTVCFYFKKPV